MEGKEKKNKENIIIKLKQLHEVFGEEISVLLNVNGEEIKIKEVALKSDIETFEPEDEKPMPPITKIERYNYFG